MKNFLKYIAIIEIVLLSGAARMLSSYFPVGPLHMVFTLVAILFFVIQKGKIQQSSFMLMLAICTWIYSDQHFFHGSADNLYVTYILTYVSCFFIISAFRFEDFKYRLLKVLQWLCFFSIIVQFLYNKNMIAGYYSPVSSLTLSAYFFNTGWGSVESPRLSSIFWEPGQFQIVLNSLLILCSNDIIDLVKNKMFMKLVRKYGIIVLSLLLTMSTTGYMVFALICFYIALNSIDKRHFLSGFISGILMLVAMYALFQSNTVQEKFNEGSDVYGSYEIRLADNLGLLQMMQDRPLIGYGIGTQDYKARALALDNETSSNGWLNSGAQLGIVFAVVLLISVTVGIRRLDKRFIGLILFVAILMAQSNEAAYYLAPLNLFIFPFKFSFHKRNKNDIETV